MNESFYKSFKGILSNGSKTLTLSFKVKMSFSNLPIIKALVLPVTLNPNTLYLIGNVLTDELQLFVSDNTGTTTKHLSTREEILSAIDNTMAEGMPYEADTILSGHHAVVIDANGKAMYADCTVAEHAAVEGVTTNAGTIVRVIARGTIELSGWTFEVGKPVFLGKMGMIVQEVPVDALFTKVLGVARSPTLISVNLQPAIFK